MLERLAKTAIGQLAVGLCESALHLLGHEPRRREKPIRHYESRPHVFIDDGRGRIRELSSSPKDSP